MDKISTLILALSLFIIMIGMGLSLTTDDFKRVLKFPLAVFVGFLNQIILLPIIAYLLISLFNVDPTIAMGVMILSACPGGPTSNLVTFLAKGDVALSVTLTAINSLLTIVTIPLIVNFGLDQFTSIESQIQAPIIQIAASLFVIIAIPLAIGMSLKKYKPTLALKMDKPVRIFSTVILIVIIVGICLKEKDHLLEHFSNSWQIVLSLNVLTMFIGFIIAKIAQLNLKQAICICVESGNQNGTLAITIAVGILAQPAFSFPAAIYSLLMYVTALVPITLGNKYNTESI